jgi:hypothetical protein
MEFNGKKVIDYDIEVESFCGHDDYCAYFIAAYLEDESQLTEDELDELTEKYPEVIDQYVWDHATGMADFLYD